LPVGKTHKGSIWRVEFIIIMIIIFWGAQDRIDIIPRGLWILEHAITYQGEA
jgi:hypothetical protein